MKINKAVITAAGLGTRFLPAVKAFQKEVVPIMDKPQIQYVIEEALDSGINQMAIVTFEGVNSIERYFSFDDDIFWKRLKSVNKEYLMDGWKKIKASCEIRYFTQTLEHKYGNGTPIVLTKDFVGNDDFYVMWGDDIMIKTDETVPNLLDQLEYYFYTYNAVGVPATLKVSDELASKCGCFKFDENSNIPSKVISLVEKPPINALPSNFIHTSRFIFKSEIIEELEKEIPGKDNEIWLTDAESRLIQAGKLFIAPTWKGYDWFQVGDPLSWLRVNIEIARKNPAFKEKLDEYLRTIV